MSVVKIIVRLGSVLLLVASGFAQSPKEPFAITISPSSDGISVGTGAVKARTGVLVIVTLTNLSDRDIAFQFTTPMCDYSVEVLDSAGELASDTEQRRSANCANRMTGRNFFKVVKPNESAKDWIDVSRMSDMSVPGEYSVQVIRKAPKEFGDLVVKSNTIKIAVTP
jgi:hypothetical protein